MHRALSHVAPTRRNVRFKGLRRVHTPPQPRTAHTAAHRAKQGTFSPSATAWLCAVSEIATERTAGGSGCTPMACVRFLRRRGPAGLRDLFRFCRSCGLYTLRSGFSAYAKRGVVSLAPRVIETLGARLSKQLICRFLRLLSSILCAVPFSANMQISLSAISVANAFPPPTTAGLCASSRIASNRTTMVSLGCMDSSSFGCLIVLDSSSTYTTRS